MSGAHVPYDDFAEIYDVWCESAPIARENQGFYVRQLMVIVPSGLTLRMRLLRVSPM